MLFYIEQNVRIAYPQGLDGWPRFEYAVTFIGPFGSRQQAVFEVQRLRELYTGDNYTWYIVSCSRAALGGA